MCVVHSQTNAQYFHKTSALESRGLLELVVTMRQVLEDHSPDEGKGNATSNCDAGALAQEDQDEGRTNRDTGGSGGGADKPVNEDAAPGRPPVAR